MTSRSKNFDMTNKFEIGRYELTCAASRSKFLMTGVMNASLNTDGKHPAASDIDSALVTFLGLQY